MERQLTVALLVACVVVATADAQEGPVVTTKYGKIRGFYTQSAAIFHGVPFARPPVGSLRSVSVSSFINISNTCSFLCCPRAKEDSGLVTGL